MDDVFCQFMAYNEPLTGSIVLTERGKAILVEDAQNVIR